MRQRTSTTINLHTRHNMAWNRCLAIGYVLTEFLDDLEISAVDEKTGREIEADPENIWTLKESDVLKMSGTYGENRSDTLTFAIHNKTNLISVQAPEEYLRED